MLSDLLAFSDMMSEVTNYFANFSSTTNACRTVLLWITIAMVVAFIVLKLVFKYTAPKPAEGEESVPDKRQTILNRAGLFAALAFVVTTIVAFTVIYFVDVKNGDDDLVPITFYPLLVFVLVAIVSAIAAVFKPTKIVKITGISLSAAALVAALICMIVYYSSGDALAWYWASEDDVNSTALYISAVAVIVVIVAIGFLSDRGSKGFDTRSITFAAVCIALSYALSFIRFFKMPMGGSITFASMLPLMLYSYMFGCKKGLLAGLVYGVLDAITDAWILHPAQFALDYFVAYSAVGLAGCLRNFPALKGKVRTQFTLGAIIAGVMRFISHFFSGVFAFGMYASGYAEEYGISALANPYFYSFVYQCMYVIPEVIIVIVVGVILLSSKNFTKQVISLGDFGKKTPEQIPATETAE